MTVLIKLQFLQLDITSSVRILAILLLLLLLLFLFASLDVAHVSVTIAKHSRLIVVDLSFYSFSFSRMSIFSTVYREFHGRSNSM